MLLTFLPDCRTRQSFRRFAMASLCMLFVPLAQANFSVPPGGSFTVPAGGSFDVSCGLLDVQGELLNDGEITQAQDVDIAGSGTLNAGSGTLFVGQNWNNSGTFIPGNSTVVVDDSCGTDPIVFTGATTFNNLTIISNSGRTVLLPPGNGLVVNGTLTLQGAGAQPLVLESSGPGLATIQLGPEALVITDNVDVASNVSIGERSSHIAAIPTTSTLGLTLLAMLLALLARARLSTRSHYQRNIRQG
ncbi:IPTL-CTERM sorting domain-containing protein [Halopseudomonas salegens]|uniref:IPTL-CTERM sorting domain-containing protein n=1 Tax=Halopseudomonas salegens TaxID=1434072 RepID=UPI0012FE56F5|nr:IPTL-CTERM sorting domain-containing protein [Halopseudomonas salegens]